MAGTTLSRIIEDSIWETGQDFAAMLQKLPINQSMTSTPYEILPFNGMVIERYGENSYGVYFLKDRLPSDVACKAENTYTVDEISEMLNYSALKSLKIEGCLNGFDGRIMGELNFNQVLTLKQVFNTANLALDLDAKKAELLKKVIPTSSAPAALKPPAP